MHCVCHSIHLAVADVLKLVKMPVDYQSDTFEGIPPDYLQGHADALERATKMVEHIHR